MIDINERFSIEKDKYCWNLHEWRDGFDKDGNPKRSKKTTYHGSIRQICTAIINKAAGECGSIEEILKVLESAESALTKLVESKIVDTDIASPEDDLEDDCDEQE